MLRCYLSKTGPLHAVLQSLAVSHPNRSSQESAVWSSFVSTYYFTALQAGFVWVWVLEVKYLKYFTLIYQACIINQVIITNMKYRINCGQFRNVHNQTITNQNSYHVFQPILQVTGYNFFKSLLFSGGRSYAMCFSIYIIASSPNDCLRHSYRNWLAGSRPFMHAPLGDYVLSKKYT